MPRIIRADFLMVPESADLERKKEEKIKMAVERARELKKRRKAEKKMERLRKRNKK